MRLGWGIAALALALAASRARADLGMTLSTEASVGDGVRVSVTATNSGDEPAHALVPEVRLQSTVLRGDAVTNLDVGRSTTWNLALPAPTGPGTFALVIRLTYADGRGHPGAADLARVIGTPGTMAAPVTAGLGIEPTAAHGTATLTLTNPTLAPVAGRVVPVLPARFTTEPESIPAQVPAQGSTVVTFIVENTSVPPGSTFPLYALFEYEQRGIHYTVLGETTLQIVAAQAAGTVSPLLVGAAALAVALGLLGVAWRRAAR